MAEAEREIGKRRVRGRVDATGCIAPPPLSLHIRSPTPYRDHQPQRKKPSRKSQARTKENKTAPPERPAAFHPLLIRNTRSCPTPTMTVTSNLTFLDFLKPRRNEAALRLRNSLIALAVLFVITSLSSAFPSILSSLTVVWNAVTPEPTPSKSRAGSGSNKNGPEIGLWWWTLSLVGACPTPGIDAICSVLIPLFPRGRSVCAAHDIDIPVCLRADVPKRSIPTYAHTSEAFQYPSQLACRVTSAKIQSPFTRGTFPRDSYQPSCTHVGLYKVTPQKQKPFNPASSTLSTSAYLTSPVSTPSRTLNYKFPAASPFNESTNSNMSMSTSVPPSPSPLLSSPLMAYRGKHPQSAGSGYHDVCLDRTNH